METDIELRDDVLAEIEWEPAVEGAEIGVAAHDGVITLSGKVATYLERTLALQAAKRVAGVTAIADEMEVAWSAEALDSDTTIAESIHRGLDTNLSVPQGSVQAIVNEGRVTLEGSVKWPYQRRAAEQTVESLRGVRSVANLVHVAPPAASPAVVKARIEAALRRRADVDASRITVRSEGDRVILEGTVPAFYEREAAVGAAWAAPGVRTVEDHIHVNPALTLRQNA
jgi:osmotically-inducible protein OsmY